MYQGNNYLLKMRKDNAFLGFKNNPFLKYFNFSDRGDPFLVIPSVEAVGRRRKRKSKKGKGGKDEHISIPIENGILKKIKKCEAIIEQECAKSGETSNSVSNLKNLESVQETSPDEKSAERSPLQSTPGTNKPKA